MLHGIGSPSQHASANVADPGRNHQRDKGLLFDKEIDRLGRALALRSRLSSETSHAPFNLVGGVLNRVRRSAFEVLDQARDVALEHGKILAKHRKIRIGVHRYTHDRNSPIVAKLRPRRCRDDHDRSLFAGKGSETTHAIGSRFTVTKETCPSK